jgi:hypothetical protein
MTSHHESGTEEFASKQRIEQLKLCFKRMINAPFNRFVIFGGDLNIREKEVGIISMIFLSKIYLI